MQSDGALRPRSLAPKLVNGPVGINNPETAPLDRLTQRHAYRKELVKRSRTEVTIQSDTHGQFHLYNRLMVPRQLAERLSGGVVLRNVKVSSPFLSKRVFDMRLKAAPARRALSRRSARLTTQPCGKAVAAVQPHPQSRCANVREGNREQGLLRGNSGQLARPRDRFETRLKWTFGARVFRTAQTAAGLCFACG